jgi:putative membrane protein
VRRDPFVRWLVVAYAILWIGLAIAPRYRSDWLLENLLVFAFAGVLLATRKRFRFSNVSSLCIALFLALHAVGAHYTYSETPFGDWWQAWTGGARNSYDRLVHFAFGLLLTIPLRELGLRVLRLRGLWSWLVPFLVALSLSAGYELIESWVARIVSPELGTAYLGTQGDEWDAQKDMGLALAGSVLALVVAWLIRRVTGREASTLLAPRHRH